MSLFGPKQLPLTSYGYQPPRDATAKGWECTNREDCSAVEHVPPRRWPVRCPKCGHPCDPVFNEPWAHDAEGVELKREISNRPATRAEAVSSRLLNWEFKDAIRRGDRRSAAAARAAIRRYADEQHRRSPLWNPVFVLFFPVWNSLDAGDLDGAADDLCYWLSVSTGEGAEGNGNVRHNARTVIDMAAKFFAAPGASAHPRAPEIRKGCLRVAEGAFQVLNAQQQSAINQMARA